MSRRDCISSARLSNFLDYITKRGILMAALAFWLAWGAIGLVFELFCVVSHNQGTLSEQIWRFEGVKGYVVKHQSLRRMVLVGGLAILAAHLWTGYI